MIDEYRQAAEDTFSLDEVANEVRKSILPSPFFDISIIEQVFAIKYTLGQNIARDHYHVGVVRGNLNRYLPDVVQELIDEIPHVFGQLIGTGNVDGTSN